MNRTYILLSACLLRQASLQAQTQPPVMSFQPAQALAAGRLGRGVAIISLRPETGKPFSATVTTQTVQTYLDGTHVSQTTTMVEYRDAEGRTRTETGQRTGRGSEPVKTIVIRDPVSGVTYRLSPASKTAMRAEITIAATARGGRGATPPPAELSEITRARLEEVNRLQKELEQASRELAAARNEPHENVEDLGTLNVNGVTAHGTRTTTIVPAGAIGNDREFHSVDERWFSSDLNLLIKSVNTDPRFGVTTYELTNISRQSPDPALFQVPADYTIVGGGGR